MSERERERERDTLKMNTMWRCAGRHRHIVNRVIQYTHSIHCVPNHPLCYTYIYSCGQLISMQECFGLSIRFFSKLFSSLVTDSSAAHNPRTNHLSVILDCYLGSTITNEGGWLEDVKVRIIKARQAIGSPNDQPYILKI